MNEAPEEKEGNAHVFSEDLGKECHAPGKDNTRCPECLVSHMDDTKKKPYRIFISYSHEDKDLAGRLISHLKALSLFPITDREIRIGEAFSEEIRDMIECAHVFMPLVTEKSNERLWVQQEIGYATAVHVPLYPITIVKELKGMHEHIQGIYISQAEAEDTGKVPQIIEERLTYATVDDLVRRARLRPRIGRYACAMFWIERQEILATLTEGALKEGCTLKKSKTADVDPNVWRLRHHTRFGSFTIPDANASSQTWSVRDFDRYQTQYERQLLRRERRAMEDYMKCFGCDMIIRPMKVEPKAAGKENDDSAFNRTHSLGTAFRLSLLIDFISEHMDDDRLNVVIPEQENSITGNLIIVGDWFATEAVLPRNVGATYDRTMFTRHAPTVLNMIARFEQDFQDSLPKGPDAREVAKQQALDKLNRYLDIVKTHLDEKQTEKLETACRELGVKLSSQ